MHYVRLPSICIFYLCSTLMGLSIPLFTLFGGRDGAIWICTKWSNMHRWGAVHILGMTIVIEGTVPSGPVCGAEARKHV
jgi:1-acyl-sn-glycerol-3-phosphate acyltransferase